MSKQIIPIEAKLPFSRAFPLALQHVFAMFGATVLVPFLTGLSPAVALFTSGIGTLIFHFFTKGKVPAYLGSSFAFIAPLFLFVTEKHSLGQAMGGAMIAGIVYLIVYLLIKAFGTDFIHRIAPSVVVGPVVIIIGLALAQTAVGGMASTNWVVAIFTLAITVFYSILGRGMFEVIPILMGILSGYLFALVIQYGGFLPKLQELGLAGPDQLINVTPIIIADWFSNPTSAYAQDFAGQLFSFAGFHLPIPEFTAVAVLAIAPIAFVTIIEDLGHIFVIGNVTEKDLIKDPGFDRVLMGNGLATIVASIFGGPPSTTYGENIGVLAITKVYSSWVIRISAIIAISLSFVGKLAAALSTIPTSVMGGICILLFGMIAAAGIRTMIEAKTDLSSTRNLIIVAVILILGVGTGKVGYATLAGIFLNLVLPEKS
ncbi:solute carrier family 23 protein [Dehalobacterium formicoaceticum]|uniref:NCS2 family nucleobase:cation symporter n=1 Tax=Dehalobacterium formicoaceticum TaxID=51515 RepID=A0ABT1Y165_9FIRM|nr:solute carrier family 23 protein [Dehalobacterium formicoaceticum]MCR6544593.1 NCS2 family nucleobase:cation symporter [Dehalobacterium formicoaceticum]